MHPRFKTPRFVAQLARRLGEARRAAADQHLSTETQRRPRGTPEQLAAGRRAATDREKIFTPIQQALVEQLGLHAARLVMSNKLVNEFLKGALTLSELKPPYRQRLIRDIAAAAGLDLSAYEGNRSEG